MSKLIGYRVLTIYSENSIPVLEEAVNSYLNDNWTLYGTTINKVIGDMNWFSQIMVKYSDSTEPRITKYRLYACNNYTCAFETNIINSVKNSWTFFGHTWHTKDSKGIDYYSQALVQCDSLNALF
jgi:hypothetical protein